MAEVPLPTPTQVPVPSTDIRNAVFAGAKLDEEVTGTSEYYTDRLGVSRLTNTGRNNKFNYDQLRRAEIFNAQITQQKNIFDNQISEQHEQFTTQITGQRDEFNDMLAASGYSWLKDYVDGPVTFTNRSQVTVYNGVAYRLAASAPIGFTTTGTDATSWENDSQYLVAIGDNDIRQQIQYQLGQWLPDAVSVFSSTDTYSAMQVRGFYSQNDGGAGIWIATGNSFPEKSGTHDISKGLIYNANGDEYSLDISSGEISVLANGAKTYSYAECINQGTDDFVCLGQAVNGILSKLTLAVTTTNNEVGYDGGSRLSLIVPTGRYRIGKEPIKGYSGVNYHFEDSRVFVYAGKSYTYAVTGKRLDGFRHGYEEIKEKWEAVNEQVYFGSVSLQDVNIYGGVFIGDHAINKTSDACSSGVAFLILNPEGVTMHRTYVKSSFHWAHVAMPAMIEPTIGFVE